MSSEHPYIIGADYFIRTVTMAQSGKLVKVFQQELVLTNAAWVADTGRFTEALASGDFSEVEMFPAGEEVIVGRGAISDAVQIKSLPSVQK